MLTTALFLSFFYTMLSLLSFLKREKTILLILLSYYGFITAIAPITAHYDVRGFFLPWITSFLSTGIENVYRNPLINYPPITLYVLYGFGQAADILNINLDTAIGYLRHVVFVFDITTFYFVLKIMQRFRVPLLASLGIFLNIALIYNTIFWGQLDSIYTFFVVFAVYFALIRRPIIATIGITCALASKPQALIFVPVILLLLLPYFLHRKRVFIKSVIAGMLTLLIVFSPYIINGTIDQYFYVVSKTTDYYPYVSMYAFNFWLIVFDIDQISKIRDHETIFGISYRTVGLGMFVLWFLAYLYPIFALVFKQIKHKHALIREEWHIVFLSMALIALAFFFFNTQMHERYVHAALILAGIFALLSNRIVVYAAISIAYLANLTYVYNALAVNPSQIITPYITALLYAGVLVYGLFELYYLHSRNKENDTREET